MKRNCKLIDREPKMITRFVMTSIGFIQTMHTNFTFVLIAKIFLVTFIVALPRTLYQQWKGRKTQHRHNRTKQQDYSSFSVSLVYLASPGLAYNLLVTFFILNPGMYMYCTGHALDKKSVDLLNNLGLLLWSLYPVASFGMAMTKPDVRKSIYDLSYISFGWTIDWFSKDTSSNMMSTKLAIEEQPSNVTKERNDTLYTIKTCTIAYGNCLTGSGSK